MLAKSQEAQARRNTKDELLCDCEWWKGWEIPRERFQVGLDQTRVGDASPNAGSAMGNIIPSARDWEYPGIPRV